MRRLQVAAQAAGAFTPYGQMLLDEMCAWAENLDFAEVARSISHTDYANYQPALAV